MILVRFTALILGNALALFLAESYIDGVKLYGGYKELILAALIIALANFFLKPGLKLIFGPFIILSLGLFVIVINMGILWIADKLLPQVEFSGLSSLFLTTMLLGIVNFIISVGLHKK